MTHQLLLLRAALDQFDEAVLVADPAGVIQYRNQAAQHLLGGPETLENVVQLGGPADLCQRVARGETVFGIPLPGLGPDIRLSASPVRDTGGAIVGMTVVLRREPVRDNTGLDALQLDAIAHAIASGRDIDTLLEHTFGFLQPLIGCDNISLAVPSPEDEDGRLRVLALRPTPFSTIFSTGEVAEAVQRVATNGVPVVVDDTFSAAFQEDALLRSLGIRSYAIYPLRGEHGILGTINLSSRTPAAFSDRVLAVIERVASHVALAVEKILLLESTERHRVFLEQVLQYVPAGVIVVGPPPDLRVLTVNKHYRGFLDEPYRSEKDLVGLPLRTIIPNLDEVGFGAALAKVFTTGETVEVRDVVYEGLERGTIHLDSWYVPLRDRLGRVEAVIGLVTDTTERVRYQRRIEELAKSAAQQATALSTIIESMVEGVYVCDGTGRVVLVNEAGARLFGITTEQALQPLAKYAEFSQARYPDGRPIPTEEMPLARGLRGETSADWEQIVRRADTGEDIHLRFAYSPIVDDRGTIVGAVAVANDMTRTRQLERQREEFLSIAAHELKTPVTSVKLFTQGMLRTLQRRGTLAPERAERDLQTILSQIDRLTRLVDDLLDVSRVRTGRLEYHFETVDLIALVEAVVDRFRRQIDEDDRYELRLIAAPDLPATVVDPHRIDQVLTNLLSNAIKYSPTGGTISVQVGPGAESGWIRIEVSDPGVGLDPPEIAGLFEPFARAAGNTTVRNISGIGLGLYISRAIVERHGGRIWAESEGQGCGSTFIVELPVRPASHTPGDDD